jgi:putative copper resistance protein D
MVAAALLISQFVHHLSTSILFGGALFPLYGFASPATDIRRATWLRLLLLNAAFLALISGISWFVLSAAEMSGTLAILADTTIIFDIFRNTIFGWVWVFRLVLALGLVLLLLLHKQVTAQRNYAALIGSLILLASIAWTGQPGSDDSVAAPVRAFHLVAAGVWVGALFVFSRLAVPAVWRLRHDDLLVLHHALEQFSGVGSVVVAILLFTGLFLLALPNTSSTYDRVLYVKLAMFVAMLVLAAANRFWLTPQLSMALDSMEGLSDTVSTLRISLLAETALATLVYVAVAWLESL